MRRSPRAIVATLAVRTWIASCTKWGKRCNDDDLERYVEKQYPKFNPGEKDYVLAFCQEPKRRMI